MDEYEKAKKLELENAKAKPSSKNKEAKEKQSVLSSSNASQENEPGAVPKVPAAASFGHQTQACGNKNEKTIQHADDENMSVPDNQPKRKATKKTTTSNYTGVYQPKGNEYWQAQIRHKCSKHNLGRHNLQCDAALAYDKAALKLRGPTAETNFSTTDEYEKAKQLELERMQTTGDEVMVDTAVAEKEETISNNTGASSIRRENVELEELSEKKKGGKGRPRKVKHCLLLPGAGQLANSQKRRKIEWKEEIPGDMVMELEHGESICFACHHGIEGGICNCF